LSENISTYDNFDNYYFKIAQNIDMSDLSFIPIGTYVSDSNNIPFEGSFDGNGFKISNFVVDLSETSYIGLFGYTENAELKKIKITNASVTGDGYVGGLIGYAKKTNISECSVAGTINGSSVIAGIAGRLMESEISECYSECDINGETFVGGFVGIDKYANEYNNCYSIASLNVTDNDDYCGGFSAGTYIAIDSSSTYIHCYSVSTAYEENIVIEGFIGGKLIMSNINNQNTFSSCIYDNTLCTNGDESESSNVIGMSSNDMKDSDNISQNYFTWDFSNIWAIDNNFNNGYPYLIENNP
ncbi:MAG: GLUG motif-containing protein, partial [Spirochaetales bacterium]|nr:GLUG motif-containing protein [Spirochaetales bacterium]